MVTARQITNGRRFGNATLDALLPFLEGYYDFQDDAGDGRTYLNKAPFGRCGPMTAQGLTPVSTGPDGKGATSASNTDYGVASAQSLVFLGRAGLTLCQWVNLADATPASAGNLLGFSGWSAAGISAQVNTDGSIRFFNGINFGITGSAGDFSDNTDAFVALVRRDNGGTPTFYLYLDGVEIGSSTTNGNVSYERRNLLTGRNSTSSNDSFIGERSALMMWSRGLSGSEISALYNSGSGRFLQGADL